MTDYQFKLCLPAELAGRAPLLVAVNDDASARRLCKGEGRPFNRCEDRMALLAARP